MELSPSKVHEIICQTLERAFGGNKEKHTLVGEVRDLADNRQITGWIIFNLVDSGGRVRCGIPPTLSRELDIDIRNGDRVRIEAAFGVNRRSQCIQMKVKYVEPAGPTQFEVKLKHIKEMLREEGLLSPAGTRLVETDPPPSNIAVIAPPYSDAANEIKVAALSEGPVNLNFSLVPMSEYSPEGLISALKSCEEKSDRIDLVIISRGSAEDFSPYNDEEVIREIARCEIPVVSAIGHSSDRTMLDFVASESFPTPLSAGIWLKELHLRRAAGKGRSKSLAILIPIIVILILVILILMSFFPKIIGLS